MVHKIYLNKAIKKERANKLLSSNNIIAIQILAYATLYFNYFDKYLLSTWYVPGMILMAEI